MTSSTDDSRAVNSGPVGTSKGTCAAVSVRLARTIRCASVASGTRNARAISSVVRPPTRRRVSATRASRLSTGWQEMKTSRRTSSSTTSSKAAAQSGSSPSRSSRPSSAVLRCSVSARRKLSIARCFAVAISHAPGRSGMPPAGHCSSAATSASCASSSASPTSPVTRVSAPTSLADSMRQTASTTRWTSTSVIDAVLPPSALLLRLDGGAQLILLLAQLGGELLAEVLGLGDLAHLDLGVAEGCLLHPLEHLLAGGDLQDPEARDELLGLGERPVDDRGPAVLVEPDAGALGAGQEPLAGEHHTRLDQLLVVGAHLGELLLGRHAAALGLVAGLDDHHVTHRSLLPR